MPPRRALKSKSAAVTKEKNEQADFVSHALGRIRSLESEMAGVIRQMQEKVQQLEYLNEFASLLNSTLDTKIVREKALEATCRLLRCETASLYLVDETRAELYWETALGDVGKQLQKTLRLPIDDRSIAGFVAMTGESLVINDVEKDPRYIKKSKPGVTSTFVSRSMICVPLRAQEKIIGVLQAINKLPSIPLKPTRHDWPDFYEEDRRLLESLSHQVATAVENSRLYGDIKKNFFETCQALAEAIEKKDRYTGGHTKRVVFYSTVIGQYLSLSPEQTESLLLGAILHDVGKIGIEDKILRKQAQLDQEEWKVMQSHPQIGYDILRKVAGLRDVVFGMRFHHERWDGKGYPRGLREIEIPLIARIISVADTFDAMVSTRPYRKGMDPKVAFDEIIRCSGTQFDPQVVEAFARAFKSGEFQVEAEALSA